MTRARQLATLLDSLSQPGPEASWLAGLGDLPSRLMAETEAENREYARALKCPRCRGMGWWSKSELVGREGYQLIGGPCDHATESLERRAEHRKENERVA